MWIKQASTPQCLVKRHFQYTLVCLCTLRLVVSSSFKISLTLAFRYRMIEFLAFSTDIGNSVCHQYEQDGVVCPANLHKVLFTVVAAVDNIDHNPSSTTAHNSFHGTGISFQPISTEHPGVDQGTVVL